MIIPLEASRLLDKSSACRLLNEAKEPASIDSIAFQSGLSTCKMYRSLNHLDRIRPIWLWLSSSITKRTTLSKSVKVSPPVEKFNLFQLRRRTSKCLRETKRVEERIDRELFDKLSSLRTVVVTRKLLLSGRLFSWLTQRSNCSSCSKGAAMPRHPAALSCCYS